MERYIETFLAGKSDVVKFDLLYNIIPNFIDIDLNIFNLYMIENKKIKFSYRLIGVDRFGKSYINAYLIGYHLIRVIFDYYDFLEFQRNIKIKKILSI